MIKIPKNDYVEDTSINEATVQEICNVLLTGSYQPLPKPKGN